MLTMELTVIEARHWLKWGRKSSIGRLWGFFMGLETCGWKLTDFTHASGKEKRV